jgi:hypothetical protein
MNFFPGKMSQQAPVEKNEEAKPKRKYSKKVVPVEKIDSEESMRSQIAVLQSKLKQKASSESNSDPPDTPKPKRLLSEKQKEALAAGRAKRLEKLKSVSENK